MNDKQASARHPARLAIVVAGVLVAVVAAAWVALAILLPPARVKALVERQLSRTLAREVRFSDARAGLFPPVRLTVRDLAISELGGFGQGTLFLTRSLHLDLDVLALLGRRVTIRRLVLDDPGLHLVLAPDGSTNLDDLMRPAPERKQGGAAFDLDVKELSIRRGRLLLDDLAANSRRTVVIDSRIALATREGGQRVATSGTTTLTGIAFGRLSAGRLANLNGSLADLAARIEHRGVFDAGRKRLALERLDVALGRARLGVVGVVDEPGPAARFDLRARAENVDFGEVLDWLSRADARVVHGVRGSGRLDCELAIRGGASPRAGRTVAGRLRVSNAAFRYPGAPAGVEALDFTARLAPDSVDIGELSARVAGQPVRASLAATRFRDPLVRFAVHGAVDLAAVSALVAPRGTKLGGRVVLDVGGRGRAKDPSGMALSGTAVLSGVSVESPQVPKRIEAVQGRVVFAASRAEVQGLSAKAGQSAIALDARVTRPLGLLAKPGTSAPCEVEFDFRAPRLDLAELLPPQSGPPIVLNATGGGRVRIDRLINQKLDVSAVRAGVRLEPGIVDVREFSMKAYGGTAVGHGRLDLSDPANPGVSLEARLDSLSADALVSTWTPARNFVQGTLNTTLDLGIQGGSPERMKQTLTAIGLAQMARGQLGPGPVLAEIAKVVRVPALERLHFDEARLPLHIERGRVVTDPVVLRGSYGEWKLAGAVGFDGSLDYAVSATLPPSVMQALSARSAMAAGALSDAEGNLLIDLRVGGTAKAPRVSWDASAMKDRVLGKASQALEQQRRKLESELEAAALARSQAAADSAKQAARRLQQSVADSLRRRAGGLIESFFGGAPKDSAQP